VTTIYPELRSALVAAADRHYQVAGSTPTRVHRRIGRRSPRPVVLVGSAGGLAAAVAAALLLSGGSAVTVAQAFPLLKKPASPLSAHPALAKRLHAASAGGVPAFQTIHAFSGVGYSGYLSQVNVGGMNMLCLGFATTDGASGRAGCSAPGQAERHGITLTDGGRFVVLVPTGGSVELTTDGNSTPVTVDSSGIASGSVGAPATLTVRVGGSTSTTRLPG
jgi:hypothetical protein